jgi:hypothetical protein
VKDEVMIIIEELHPGLLVAEAATEAHEKVK